MFGNTSLATEPGWKGTGAVTALSVVCALHDATAYLPTLLTSLTRARLDDAELIFVDDGSSDHPEQLLGDFSARLGRVHVIRLDEPAGPASARNRGTERATGDYLTYVDADDWVGLEYFATMLTAMRRTDADFGRTDQTRVVGTRRTLFRPEDSRYDVALDPRSAILPTEYSTMVDFPYSHSGIFHRRLLDDGLLLMPEGLRTAEDRPWIWRLHLHARSYVRIPTAEYFYRRGVESSLTQVGDERQLDFIPAFTQVLDLLLNDPANEPYAAKGVRQCLAVVSHHLRSAGRLAPGLRHQMSAGVRRMLSVIPDDVLAEQLRTLGVGRADLIRHHHPELHRL